MFVIFVDGVERHFESDRIHFQMPINYLSSSGLVRMIAIVVLPDFCSGSIDGPANRLEWLVGWPVLRKVFSPNSTLLSHIRCDAYQLELVSMHGYYEVSP